MESLPHKVIFFDIGKTLVTSNTSVWSPGARELLVTLRAQRIRLGVISNTADLTREALKDLLPPDFDWSLFDEPLIILSSEVRVKKPERAIFEKALTAAAVSASSCLYCSEDLVETIAAQQVGMHEARVDAAAGELNDFVGVLQTAAGAA
jgi:FMN phosphatase YigB (HAD superfamily)